MIFEQILVNAFENAYPSINVKVVFGPTDTDVKRRELTEALSHGKNAPDVYLGDVIWPAEFAEAGLAMNLDGVFEPDFWKRFAPELLPAAKYRGRFYAAPFFASQGILFYRTDLMATPPRTWEQLVQESRNLLKAHRVEYGYLWQGAPYEGLTCNWVEVLADAGGSTLDPDGTSSRLNSPAALKALRFLRGLVTDKITPPQVDDFREPDSAALFMAGQAAFLRGWNSMSSRVVTPASTPVYGKVGVAPLPTFAGRPGPGYSAIGGWSMFVNPHTRELDAVKTFIRWMTDVDAQRILGRLSQIPTNAQVRNHPGTLENPAVNVGLDVNPVARPSNTPRYPGVSRAVYSAVNAVLDGKRSPEAALRDVDRDIDAMLR